MTPSLPSPPVSVAHSQVHAIARTIFFRRLGIAALWSAVFFVTMAVCCITFVAATLSMPVELVPSYQIPSQQAADTASFTLGNRVAQAIVSMQESDVFWGLLFLSFAVAVFGSYVEVLPGSDADGIRRTLESDANLPLPALCPNCSTTYLTDAGFCHRCGQERSATRPLTMRRFAVNALPDTLNVDGRFLPTLWLLLSKPGVLTREYMSLRRIGHSAPLQIYVVVTALFFFVSTKYEFNVETLTNLPGLRLTERIAKRAAAEGVSTDLIKLQLDEQHQTYLPFYTFVIIIVFAAVLRMLYHRRTYAEHLIFAMHVVTAFLLFWIAFIGVGLVVPPLARIDGVLATFVSIVYLVIALRVDYQRSYGDRAVWKVAAAVMTFALLFALYTAISIALGIFAL
jgi:hypothetical protein